MAKKLSEIVKLNLRFSEELRRKLEKAAERNNQSMNLEIVARLEESFRKEEMRDVVKEAVREVATSDFFEAIMGKTRGGDK
jgi:hypothetical protein